MTSERFRFFLVRRLSSPINIQILHFFGFPIFHDRNNHNLALINFPKGKGLKKWQKSAVKIFLGIDHTAIVISNTDNSHHFYMNLLGIERKGDSWNKGTEQEQLNNVEGASLHVKGYRSAKGPGLEFL